MRYSGISLKLADHRFLFVNSHLAAHTARVNVRLANIAKIKADLRIDTFLAKDDPLQELEDLTDRFDTVFWCGDLNFRLDLSRLHTEWLIEKKKYNEALMWDQLRNTMKDETRNPFPGFQEHSIDFPPTFKYDVSQKPSNDSPICAYHSYRFGTLLRQFTKRHAKLYDGEQVPTPAGTVSNPLHPLPICSLRPHLSAKTCPSFLKSIQMKNATRMSEMMVVPR